MTVGGAELPAAGPDPVMVMAGGLEASVTAEGAELPAAGPDPVMVMTAAEEPGPPGKVTVNTGAASDSAVDANEGAAVARDEADATGPVPTVDSKVKVKLAVLIVWEEGSLVEVVATGETEVVPMLLKDSITV